MISRITDDYYYFEFLPLNITDGPIEILLSWFVTLQEGDFEMKHIDKVGSKTFNVAIAPFSLSTLEDDTDTFWEVKRDAILEKEWAFFDTKVCWPYQYAQVADFVSLNMSLANVRNI